MIALICVRGPSAKVKVIALLARKFASIHRLCRAAAFSPGFSDTPKRSISRCCIMCSDVDSSWWNRPLQSALAVYRGRYGRSLKTCPLNRRIREWEWGVLMFFHVLSRGGATMWDNRSKVLSPVSVYFGLTLQRMYSISMATVFVADTKYSYSLYYLTVPPVLYCTLQLYSLHLTNEI